MPKMLKWKQLLKSETFISLYLTAFVMLFLAVYKI